ncbi:hypothetical protein FM103_15110 [Corynebacterium xerosis]|nr:hypothetical protein FM103_15110 [Corynebacterium xerosis]
MGQGGGKSARGESIPPPIARHRLVTPRCRMRRFRITAGQRSERAARLRVASPVEGKGGAWWGEVGNGPWQAVTGRAGALAPRWKPRVIRRTVRSAVTDGRHSRRLLGAFSAPPRGLCGLCAASEQR